MLNRIKNLLGIFKKDTNKTLYLDDKRVMEDLDKLFPQLEIKPNTTQQEVMYNAGQRMIIQHINYKLGRGK